MTGRSAYSVLRDPLFSPFRLIVLREARLALVLNPKVATTFLRDLLTEGLRQAGKPDPSNGRYPFLKMARRMPVARLRDYRHFLSDPGAYAIYAIVRDPYARAVSAWRDKFLDGHNATPDGADAGYPRSMRKGELAKMRAHARARGLPGAEPGTLVPFATFVDSIEAGTPGRRNTHWEEQRRVILFDTLPYTGTWRMEDGLGEPLAQAFAPLGIDPDWVREKAGTPRNASSKGASVLDEDLCQRLQRIYARDFEAFGYDPEGWRQMLR
ncbi:sulfotransferase family 2 domain-containing protein [Halovulum sp. GXIMD14794]